MAVRFNHAKRWGSRSRLAREASRQRALEAAKVKVGHPAPVSEVEMVTDPLKEALRNAERDDDLRTANYQMKQLRDFLAGALCAVCGEELGHDEEIISDEQDRTIHKHCEGHDDD